MAAPKPSSSKIKQPQIIIVLIVVFLILITGLILGGLRAAELFRQAYLQRQEEQAKPPEDPVRREVKRILLKKELEDGSVRFFEILPNGKINIYDENMNLLETDLSSYYKVQALFDKINDNLDLFSSDGQGNVSLTINTNMGDFSFVFDQTIEDDIHDIINDIIDDIDDVVDDAFSPTPTLGPTPTPAPGQPTATPIPTSTPPPGAPTPTPDPNATPTPIPDYMTAPPFKCEDYSEIDRPTNVSNIICGLDI